MSQMLLISVQHLTPGDQLQKVGWFGGVGQLMPHCSSVCTLPEAPDYERGLCIGSTHPTGKQRGHSLLAVLVHQLQDAIGQQIFLSHWGCHPLHFAALSHANEEDLFAGFERAAARSTEAARGCAPTGKSIHLSKVKQTHSSPAHLSRPTSNR